MSENENVTEKVAEVVEKVESKRGRGRPRTADRPTLAVTVGEGGRWLDVTADGLTARFTQAGGEAFVPALSIVTADMARNVAAFLGKLPTGLGTPAEFAKGLKAAGNLDEDAFVTAYNWVKSIS